MIADFQCHTRRVRVVERISDILPQPNLAVIVASLNTLSSTHLHHIYEGARIAPGLICATYGHSVRSQILVRSAAARLRAIDAGEPWIISVPNLRVGSEDILGWRIMGSQSEAQETTKAMSGGQGVLAISTHSDGIDAFLGPSLTLCPFKRAGISFDGANSPSCKTTGFCHRLKMPLADAIMSEQTISPDILSARVLIMDACYGLLLANSPVSPTYGLSSRFMHSATLGAIITTWELALLDVRKLQPILLDLGRGLSIGRAVGNFNRSSYARTWAHRFCILGDPDVRITQNNAPLIRHFTARVAEHVSNEALTDLTELRFCRAYLDSALNGLSAAGQDSLPEERATQKAESVKRAIDALRKYELSILHRNTEHNVKILRQRLHIELIEDIFIRGSILHDWAGFVRSRRVRWMYSSCWNCGEITKLTVARLTISRVAARRIVLCPCCGVIEDAPAHSTIRFSINNECNEVSLVGDLPQRLWKAALMIRYRIREWDTKWPWPADETGYPRKAFRIPEELHNGPATVLFVIVAGGSIAVLGRELHTNLCDPADHSALRDAAKELGLHGGPNHLDDRNHPPGVFRLERG